MIYTMYNYTKEQPEVLRRIVSERKHTMNDFAKMYAENEINQIIITGSGTSYNVGVSAKYFIEKLLNIEVLVEYPSQFMNHKKIYNNALVIGVSQSGKSTATRDSIKKANDLGLLTLAITANEDSMITHYAKHTIIMLCGNENVGAKTKGCTSSMLLLYLMALEIAYNKNNITNEQYNKYIEDINATIDNIDNIITATDKWYMSNKEDLTKATKISVVGYGVNYGTVLEGALKLLETVRCPVSSYEFEEFLHGPYNAIDEDSYLIFIASPGKEQSNIHKLEEFVSNLTKHSYMILNSGDNKKRASDLSIEFYDNEEFMPLEYIIPFQVLSYRLAIDKGINPSVPKFSNFHTIMQSKLDLVDFN